MKCHLAKTFAALFAFVSNGIVLSALVFVFGPVLGTLIKVGFEYVEENKTRSNVKSRKMQDKGHTRSMINL